MVLKIKKSRYGCGRVKIYGEVSSAKGPFNHTVVRLRTKGMKRWLCDCESFLFRKACKRRHCQHLKAAKHAAMKKFNMRWKSL